MIVQTLQPRLRCHGRSRSMTEHIFCNKEIPESPWHTVQNSTDIGLLLNPSLLKFQAFVRIQTSDVRITHTSQGAVLPLNQSAMRQACLTFMNNGTSQPTLILLLKRSI